MIYIIGKVVEQFMAHETTFNRTKNIIEIISIFIGVPFFFITKKLNRVIIASSLISSLSYTVCYLLFFRGKQLQSLIKYTQSNFFLGKQGFSAVFMLANTVASFSFLCTSLLILERSPTSHRATVIGLVTSSGIGIAKLLLIFCIKYLKVCISFSFIFRLQFIPLFIILSHCLFHWQHLYCSKRAY